MSPHVALINELGFSPTDFVVAKDRENTIRDMAAHLVAAAAGPLDLDNERDVICYLKCHTPEQYMVRTITLHLDAALDLARQTIAAAAEGLR